MAIAIAFMYVCALLLAPFIAFAMWMAFDVDATRRAEELPEALNTTPAVNPTELTLVAAPDNLPAAQRVEQLPQAG